MKRGLQILVVATVCLVAGYSSHTVVTTVERNTESAELAEAAPRALLRACQNLNKAITTSQDPKALAPSLLLIAEIREGMTAAERREHDRLAKEAESVSLHRTRCDQLVERAFP